MPVVRDGKFDHAWRRFPSDSGFLLDGSGELNVPAIGRVFGGIAKQVHEHLREARGVGV